MSDDVPGFEWDDAKSQYNAFDRGFDFGYASRIWEGDVLERVDHRRDYGEIRIQALGTIEGRHFVVVFTWRGHTRRIISARYVHDDEVLKWGA